MECKAPINLNYITEQPMKGFHFGKISLSIVISTVIFIGSPLVAKNEAKGKLATISNQVGKGQWTIVEAWHHKCKICMSSMPAMVKSIGTYPNTKVIGVSLDGNVRIAQNVIKQYRINFPTLMSNVKEFDAYVKKVAKRKLTGVPTFLIFSPQGQLVAYQSGKITPLQLRNFISKQSR
ncbi:MAG TPA: TlpA family protein disulfide reductase [Leucothrix mucor]|uniref:TlpA family protein disulfide reductase n=1 Tax=Leucothrix mucor TaxID=45248 RepID=A0A7V2WUL0_LEUMU|nr:TlpA family protein disulfide reductase [Leucothrix mucor]